MDLNLLTALDVLLEEQSVSAAAERLGVTQPAMSRTLSRIRRLVDDEVLVRSGRLMLPTPYAEAVRAEVHELVQRSSTVLTGRRELDLQRLERTFTLRCHDALTDLIAPTLITDIGRAAPGVRLRFLAESANGADGLRSAETDLEVGSSTLRSSETRAERFGVSPLVLVTHRDREIADAVTPADYAALLHVSVSRRGHLHDPIDERLAGYGLTRRVMASVPTTRLALDLVQTGELATTIPAVVFDAVVRTDDLLARHVPFLAEPVEVWARWHARHDADPAHRWLRACVRSLFTNSLDAASGCAAATRVPVDS